MCLIISQSAPDNFWTHGHVHHALNAYMKNITCYDFKILSFSFHIGSNSNFMKTIIVKSIMSEMLVHNKKVSSQL